MVWILESSSVGCDGLRRRKLGINRLRDLSFSCSSSIGLMGDSTADN